MPLSPTSSGPSVQPSLRASTPIVQKTLFGMQFNHVRNERDAFPCQLSYTRGQFEQISSGDAIRVADGVMQAALASESPSAKNALNITRDLIAGAGSGRIGPILLNNLTVFGAVRAGLAALVSESGGDAALTAKLREFDKSIVAIGVAAGKCKVMPEAYYRKETAQVLAAVDAAKALMMEASRDVGPQQLLRGMAQSVLPNAMLQSVRERLPHLLPSFEAPDGSEDLMQALSMLAVNKLERDLSWMLSMNDPDAFSSATLRMLKVPQYIMEGQPGSAADTPENPRRSNVPPSPPFPDALRNPAANGSGSNYINNSSNNSSYTPVHVDNNLSGLFDLLKTLQPPRLESLGNVKLAHSWGQRVGELNERAKWQAKLIERQNRIIEDLSARVRGQDDRPPESAANWGGNVLRRFDAPETPVLVLGHAETDTSDNQRQTMPDLVDDGQHTNGDDGSRVQGDRASSDITANQQTQRADDDLEVMREEGAEHLEDVPLDAARVQVPENHVRRLDADPLRFIRSQGGNSDTNRTSDRPNREWLNLIGAYGGSNVAPALANRHGAKGLTPQSEVLSRPGPLPPGVILRDVGSLDPHTAAAAQASSNRSSVSAFTRNNEHASQVRPTTSSAHPSGRSRLDDFFDRGPFSDVTATTSIPLLPVGTVTTGVDHSEIRELARVINLPPGSVLRAGGRSPSVRSLASHHSGGSDLSNASTLARVLRREVADRQGRQNARIQERDPASSATRERTNEVASETPRSGGPGETPLTSNPIPHHGQGASPVRNPFIGIRRTGSVDVAKLLNEQHERKADAIARIQVGSGTSRLQGFGAFGQALPVK